MGVAITIERCRAEYLLVEVDDDDFITPKNDDVGKDDDPVKEPKNDDVGKNGDVVRVPNNDDEIRKQEIEQLKRDNICDIKPCCCDSCYPCDYEVIAKLRKIAEERKAPENRQNSTLSGSKSCPIACPNCCDDDACGAEEQKYCYECCPAPNKKQDSKPKQEGDKCASDSECGEGLECKNENHFHPFGINFKFPNLTCVKKEGCARPKQDGKCRLTGQNVTYFDDRSGECRTHIFNGCKDNGHVSVSADPSECTNLRKGCTPCQVHRDSVMEEISEQNLVGSFVPSCEKSGHFKTKQFSASSGYSFCFDKNGNKVESSNKREWIQKKLVCQNFVLGFALLLMLWQDKGKESMLVQNTILSSRDVFKQLSLASKKQAMKAMRTAQPFPMAHQPLSDPKASKNLQEAMKSKSKNALEIWFMAIAIPIVSLANFVERTITEDVLKFVEKDVDVQEV